MIQLLELNILQALKLYYSLHAVWGLLFLLAGVVLIILQFQNREKFYIGIAGAILLITEFCHWFFPSALNGALDACLRSLNAPGPHVAPFTGAFGFLEYIFMVAVGSSDTRFFHQELIFVLGSTYLGLVAWHAYTEFKRTGEIFGEMSLTSTAEDAGIRPTRSDKNELGSGDLAAMEDIARWIKPSGKSGDTSLPITNLYGSTGLLIKKGTLVWTREERNRHILAIAKTGSGKTTKLILPILYNDCMCKDRSTIVIDSKPEMWSKLAMMTKKYNPEKRIILFNPLDPARSLSWNILSKIEDDTDCKLIANTIIMATDNPSSKGDSPFFRNNALSVLNAIMVGLLNDPNDLLSMPRIHELVQSGMKPLCDWLEAHPLAYRTSRTFVELARSGSQNADTIMSELGMRLSAWDLKAIRSTTAFNEFDIEDLVKHPTLFVIEFRESELEMLRPLANVIVIELLRYLTKTAERCPGVTLPRPVGMVIDEFASALGRLPDIHVKLNTLRSRNVSIVAAIQSIGQVKANYSDDADSVLAGFSSKICMPALDTQDAEWASKETGQMTIRFETASTGSNRKMIEWFASKNISKQEQVQQRAVLTPDEIGRPADNRSTFFMPNTPPFQGFLVPYYKIAAMEHRIAEFDKPGMELQLRDEPIKFEENLPIYQTQNAAPSTAPAAGGEVLAAGITNTAGWTEKQIEEKLTEVKAKIAWDATTGSAKQWWEAFEAENMTRRNLILRLAEELLIRNATITDFFLAYIYSNTDNIQANLHYLDYTRLKKSTEEQNSGSGSNGQSQVA